MVGRAFIVYRIRLAALFLACVSLACLEVVFSVYVLSAEQAPSATSALPAAQAPSATSALPAAQISPATTVSSAEQALPATTVSTAEQASPATTVSTAEQASPATTVSPSSLQGSSDVREGICGTCVWEYIEGEGGEVALYLRPSDGQLGTLEGWTDVPPWRAKNLKKYSENAGRIVVKETVRAITCRSMFKDFRRVESIDLTGLTTEKVTDMASMFEGCSALKELNGNRLSTSKVTDMSRVFFECASLASLTMSTWKTLSAKDMTDMFLGLPLLSDITLNREFHFADTSPVYDVGSHVGTHWVRIREETRDKPDVGAKGGTSHDKPAYEASPGKPAAGTSPGKPPDKPKDEVFASFSDLMKSHNKLNGPGFERYVLQARRKGTCGSCTWEYVLREEDSGIKNATKGDTYTLKIFPTKEEGIGVLENWEDQKQKEEDVTPPWNRPFCSDYYQRTVEIVIPSRKNSAVSTSVEALTAMGMFKNFTALQSLDVLGLDTANVTNVSYLFANCSTLKNVDVSTWNMRKVTNTKFLFDSCHALSSVSGLSKWSVMFVTNMEGMFKNCSALTFIGELQTWYMGFVTNTSSMFQGCKALTSLGDLSNWKTLKIESMHSMFRGCSALTKLDVAYWDTRSLKNANAMFRDCHALTSVGDLDNWDTRLVTDMGWMFSGCYALASIGDSSMWHTCLVESMQFMFSDCHALTSLDMEGWNTFNVTTMTCMFSGTHHLANIRMGRRFSIAGDSCFDEVGSEAGTHWMYVSRDTEFSSRDKIFSTAHELVEFHERYDSFQAARYIRITPMLTVTFAKGADDVKGKMEPLAIAYGTPVALSKNMYRRDGYAFSGWRDPEGKMYIEGMGVENRWLERTTHRVFTALWEPRAHLSTPGDDSAPGDDEANERHEPTKFIDEPLAVDEVREISGEVPLMNLSRPIGPIRETKGGWHSKGDKDYYYREDGSKLSGWQQLMGTPLNPYILQKNWYYFDKQGAVMKGIRELASRFPDAKGVRKKYWFYLDKRTGALCYGWQSVKDGDEELWRYFSTHDGRMLTGKRYLVGIPSKGKKDQEKHWFYLEKATGIPHRDWYFVTENGVENWYYFNKEDATMLTGAHYLMNPLKDTRDWFYFDEKTGARVRGWRHDKEKNEWYYYGPDGAMLKGQHELIRGKNKTRDWFYFDEKTGARVHGWKYISHENKLRYYGQDGAMLRGRYIIKGKPYCFDKVTGALRTCPSR